MRYRLPACPGGERLRGQELGHERRGRPLDEVGERALLDDAPRGHEGDGAAEERRLADVVGHQHDGLAEGREEPAELALELRPDDRIERAERLVEEEHGRIEHERPHEPDALALPAAELARIEAQAVVVEPHHRSQLGRALASPRRRPAVRFGGKRHVLIGGEMRVEPAVLHDVAHALHQRGSRGLGDAASRPPAPRPRPARTRPRMSRRTVDLPEPLEPSSTWTAPRAHVDRHVVERHAAAKALGDRSERDHSRATARPRRRAQGRGGRRSALRPARGSRGRRRPRRPPARPRGRRWRGCGAWTARPAPDPSPRRSPACSMSQAAESLTRPSASRHRGIAGSPAASRHALERGAVHDGVQEERAAAPAVGVVRVEHHGLGAANGEHARPARRRARAWRCPAARGRSRRRHSARPARRRGSSL